VVIFGSYSRRVLNAENTTEVTGISKKNDIVTCSAEYKKTRRQGWKVANRSIT